MDPNLFAKLITLATILLVSFPVHEASHAFAAYRLGDGTAKLFGRLTLNPIAHFDPVGGLMLIITFIASPFGFGWAKPTPVNPRMLSAGRSGEAIVAAAGPISNFALAALGGIVFRALNGSFFEVVGGGVLATGQLERIVAAAILYFVIINLALMVFNFVPIPPLDGSKVLFAALDPSTEYQVRPVLEQYGFLILIVLILPIGPGGSVLGQLLQAIIAPLANLLTGAEIF